MLREANQPAMRPTKVIPTKIAIKASQGTEAAPVNQCGTVVNSADPIPTARPINNSQAFSSITNRES